jgi:foldase protein PrsA
MLSFAHFEEEVVVKAKFLAVAFTLLTAALVLTTAAGCGSPQGLPKDVLAEVGGVQIDQQQFDAELAMFKGIYTSRVPDEETNPDQYKDFEVFVLNHMVTYEVAQQKATTFNVSVSDQEIQDYIASIKTNSFGDDQAKFDAALQSAGLTLDQLQTYYTEQSLIQKVSTEVTKDVAAPSDAEISAYYDANKSSYYQDETRTARHILIVPKAAGTSNTESSSSTTASAPSDADWAAALATAQKVRADLVGGADWKVEAAEYSDDPGTKDSGGDLGTIKKGQMVAEFEQAVFSLAKDEISEPVKTVYGYHIIQVTGITPAKQQTLDEAKASIARTLLAQKKNQFWSDWLTKTKAELQVTFAAGWESTTTTTTVAPAEDTSTTVAPAESTTTTS